MLPTIVLVGRPNVGKSTLFNAITKKSVPAVNYPFCAIDPSVGIVPVPDDRLEKLSKISQSKKIIPAVVDYQNKLIKNVEGLFNVLGDKAGKEAAKGQIELIQRIAIHMNKMKASADAMLMARKAANKLTHAEEKAFAYCDTVKVHFDEIRYHADIS